MLLLWQQHPVTCCDSMGRSGNCNEDEAIKPLLLQQIKYEAESCYCFLSINLSFPYYLSIRFLKISLGYFHPCNTWIVFCFGTFKIGECWCRLLRLINSGFRIYVGSLRQYFITLVITGKAWAGFGWYIQYKYEYWFTQSISQTFFYMVHLPFSVYLWSL